MSIPAGDLTLLRTMPHKSELYLVIQQAQYSTDDGASYTGYDWSCRIDGAHTDDPTVTLTVDGGGAAVDLLDGQTVLIGSSYGAWDSAVCRVRGDQTVGPGTVALDIGTSSDVRGHVSDDDYVVVLDEFRFWQRYGRIEIVAEEPVWYKDYDILWDDIGATDAERRLAMLPPVPNMGPHAVKFVEIGGSSSSFYFDWSDSYAAAPGQVITTWDSSGEQDHAGNKWNSALETPGWQTTDDISGLRGFRVVLNVSDGNGNATSLPFRRGIRYVFTLRRPGETQPGDPPNAEPIVNFELAEPVSGDFQQGYWRTSITVFGDEAAKYNIMPEALVILFTEDVYGTTDGSLGPISDRENILMTGRIVDGTIRQDTETGDVTFDVASPGAQAVLYHNYPVPIQYDDASTDWIYMPGLNVDRALHYYTTWHTTLNQIADFYQSGDTNSLYANDFLEGDIFSTLDRFLHERIFARFLCDKYGRFHCEIDGQELTFGSTTTLWTMQSADWLEEVSARHRYPSPVNAAECAGIIYSDGLITPKMSRAPGIWSRYRGVSQASTSLAIASQAGLNTTCGRHLNALNYEYEIDFRLAGNWRYCDIAPQRVVDIGSLVTGRETLSGDYFIRSVTNTYDPEAGCIFTDIQTEQEMDDGVAGVTIDIPEELPTPSRPHPSIPVPPGLPPLPGWPETDEGRRIISTWNGVYVTDDITAASPIWYEVNTGFSTSEDSYVWGIARDPFHWWTSGGSERTLWAVTRTGVWKHEDFPSGTWVQQLTFNDFQVQMGYNDIDSLARMDYSKINMSIETDGHYVVGTNLPDGAIPGLSRWYACAFVCQGAAIVNGTYLAPMTCFTAGGRYQGYHEVKFDPTSADQTIYALPGREQENVANTRRELFRTVNGGGAWGSVDGPYTFGQINEYGSLSVPYEDSGTYVLWGSLTTHRVSANSGASFSDVPNITAVDCNVLGTSSLARRIWFAAANPNATACRYTIDSGTTWSTIALGGPSKSHRSWTYWQGDAFQTALVGGEDVVPVNIELYRYSGGSWADKIGNLLSFGSHGEVTGIERDSMGSA